MPSRVKQTIQIVKHQNSIAVCWWHSATYENMLHRNPWNWLQKNRRARKDRSDSALTKIRARGRKITLLCGRKRAANSTSKNSKIRHVANQTGTRQRLQDLQVESHISGGGSVHSSRIDARAWTGVRGDFNGRPRAQAGGADAADGGPSQIDRQDGEPGAVW